jgi:hypothetical protein
MLGEESEVLSKAHSLTLISAAAGARRNAVVKDHAEAVRNEMSPVPGPKLLHRILSMPSPLPKTKSYREKMTWNQDLKVLHLFQLYLLRSRRHLSSQNLVNFSV